MAILVMHRQLSIVIAQEQSQAAWLRSTELSNSDQTIQGGTGIEGSCQQGPLEDVDTHEKNPDTIVGKNCSYCRTHS